MGEYRWTTENCPDGYEMLLGPDGSEVTMLTEPEDRQGCRDLKPVTDELNALAKRVEEQSRHLDAAYLNVETLAKRVAELEERIVGLTCRHTCDGGDALCRRCAVMDDLCQEAHEIQYKRNQAIATRRKGRA